MAPGPLKPVDQRFIGFLRATLGKMAGTGVIAMDLIDLDFWSAWPRRFYNVRTYDLTKENFEVPEALMSSLEETMFQMPLQVSQPDEQQQQQQQQRQQQQQQQQQQPQPRQEQQAQPNEMDPKSTRKVKKKKFSLFLN